MSVENFQHLVGETFHNIESRLNGAAAGPLHAVRRKALENFELLGIPTTRNEEWKYTNILPAMAHDYKVSRQSIDPSAAPNSDASVGLIQAIGESHRIRLVNGQLDVASLVLPDNDSVTVEVLTDAYVKQHPEVATWLETLTPSSTHPFVAANAAMTDNGIVVRFRANKNSADAKQLPLHISVLNNSNDAETIVSPHVFIIVEPYASCTIVEEHVSQSGKACFTNTVTQIVAEHDSAPTYVKIIDAADNEAGPDVTHVGHTNALVHADASLTCITLCLGGKTTRNELEIRLTESGAETKLYGLSVLNDKELADNHTLVDHLAPRCHSEEEYKGVYDGRSTGVFNGKIMVRPDAQKTTAYQSNRTVLLSPSAQINAKPQLEIFADDVKCSHGATVGQIDEEAVFYLQSRGIGYEDARALIVYAFAADIVEHIPHEAMRLALDRRIANKLGAHPFEL